MDHEKQNGIFPGTVHFYQNSPVTPKRTRSRSPSPSTTSWKPKNSRMPKHKGVARQRKVYGNVSELVARQHKLFGSVSEDENADSALSSPAQVDDQVFGPTPSSPSYKPMGETGRICILFIFFL